jgi:hypothetical protein
MRIADWTGKFVAAFDQFRLLQCIESNRGRRLPVPNVLEEPQLHGETVAPKRRVGTVLFAILAFSAVSSSAVFRFNRPVGSLLWLNEGHP